MVFLFQNKGSELGFGSLEIFNIRSDSVPVLNILRVRRRFFRLGFSLRFVRKLR